MGVFIYMYVCIYTYVCIYMYVCRLMLHKPLKTLQREVNFPGSLPKGTQNDIFLSVLIPETSPQEMGSYSQPT